MRSPLRRSSSSPQELVTAICLITLAACGGGDGITLPGESEPASIVVMDGDGQQGVVGKPLIEPLVVQVTDVKGRPVEGATVAFDFGSAGAGAAVVPQEKTTDSEGLADARLVLGNGVGEQTGKARVVQAEGRGPIEASFKAIALTENAHNMAAVAGEDQTGHVGQALDDRLVVEVTDNFGNPVAGVRITWVAIGGGTVSEEIVETDEDGRSRVDRTLGPTVGEQSTEARADGLAGSPVTFRHTALAGDASRLVILSGNEQTAEAGTLLPGELVVQLIDAEGNGVPQTAVSWVVATGGGTATPTNSTTDGNGRATARWTLGATIGQQRLDAVVSGVGIATFRATGTAGAPASLFIRTQPAATARNGIPFSRQPVVQLRDSQGNDVAQAGVEVTVAIGSGGGELGGTRQVTTDAAGRATFDGLSISGAPGARTLVFTAPGYAQVTSDEIAVEAVETATTITGDSPDPSGMGTTFTVSFRVTSPGPTPTGSVTVSDGVQSCSGALSSGAGSCPLTLSTVGVRTLTATYAGGPGLTGSSGTEAHTVTAAPPPPPAPTVTTITDDSPDPATTGTTFTVRFTVTATGATPTGSVTVTVSGGTPACTGTLSGGAGSCQLTLNTVGQRTLTATYSGGPGLLGSSDTEPHTVSAPTPSNREPDADYNWDCTGLTCRFTDASDDDDGDVVSWRWDFGGTGASNERNPTHTFPGPGEYQVTLTVTDDDGATDASSAGVEVEGPPPANQAPSAAFSVDCNELECDFEDESRDNDGDISRRAWAFGDGGTSDNRNPEHRYGSNGTYQVTLTVTDDDGATATASRAVTVAENPPPNAPPTAAFTSASCTAGQPCQFTDQSSDTQGGTIAARQWQFQDGNPASSSDANPSVTFSSAGSKTVSLTVTDNGGATDTETRQVDVAAPPVPNSPPTADFAVPSCTAGQPCQFTDASSDSDGSIAGRSWTFQDGTPAGSTDATLSVTFASEGSKTVTLTVTDDDGATSTATKQVPVGAPEPGSLGLLTQPPSRIGNGRRLNPEPEVELRDASGNVVQVSGVTVRASIASGGGNLDGDTSEATDRNGRVTFEELSIDADDGAIVTLAFNAPGYARVDSQPIQIEEETDDD